MITCGWCRHYFGADNKCKNSKCNQYDKFRLRNVTHDCDCFSDYTKEELTLVARDLSTSLNNSYDVDYVVKVLKFRIRKEFKTLQEIKKEIVHKLC